MPDPKLKEAMEEIKAVLRKHDIAAVVLLNSNSHGEHLYEFGPSWSAAKLEDNGMLRVRAKRVDFPSAEEHQKVVKATIGMFASFHTMMQNAEGALVSVLEMLGRHIDFTHADWRDD